MPIYHAAPRQDHPPLPVVERYPSAAGWRAHSLLVTAGPAGDLSDVIATSSSSSSKSSW